MERIQKWDILKFALIFLVVLGHVTEFYVDDSYHIKALWCWIYSFHMPLFIFITGIFSKKNINERRYNNIISYLFIYIVTKVLLLFCSFAVGEDISFSLFTEDHIPWYALAVFAFSLLTIVAKRFPKRYVFFFSILLACVAGYDASIGDFLALSRIIAYYPFFFAGYCLNGERVIQFLSKTYIRILAAIYFVIYTAIFFFKIEDLYFLRPLLTGRNPFSKLGEYANYGGLLRLGYYVIIFLFCASVIALIPNRLGKKGYFARLGSRTLQVYMLHFCLIRLLYGFFDMNAFFDNTSYYLVVLLALLITWFFSLRFWGVLLDFLVHPKWRLPDEKGS